MDLPHRTLTLLSLSTSFCISGFAPRFLLAGSFLSTWLFLHLSLLVLVGVVWQALLWPRFFSPLRGIPSVPVRILCEKVMMLMMKAMRVELGRCLGSRGLGCSSWDLFADFLCVGRELA